MISIISYNIYKNADWTDTVYNVVNCRKMLINVFHIGIKHKSTAFLIILSTRKLRTKQVQQGSERMQCVSIISVCQ
jgi:hypothetical protein